ncbi:hypothetical protein L218DRAFT_994099 [Marasmius fiardii PR-910]|nr:hypothetical protein L218DRAFT_994099 [Marasmius fiardii PR-910]
MKLTPPNLTPGTYKIINVEGGTAIDLSKDDGKSVLANTEKYEEFSNQQWIFERLGAGYSIRCVRNGAYLSVNLRNGVGESIEASFYPVSWELQVFDLQNNIYWIGWPEREAVFDLHFGKPWPGNKVNIIDKRDPINKCQLWRLVECAQRSTKATPPQSSAERDSVNVASDDWDAYTETTMVSTPTPGQAINDIVNGAKGLRIGGNGELAITTTTTTTTVTRVKRLNVG